MFLPVVASVSVVLLAHIVVLRTGILVVIVVITRSGLPIVVVLIVPVVLVLSSLGRRPFFMMVEDTCIWMETFSTGTTITKSAAELCPFWI